MTDISFVILSITFIANTPIKLPSLRKNLPDERTYHMLLIVERGDEVSR